MVGRIRSALQPDAPAVAVHYALADGEADAGALVFLARVEALEDLEDAVRVARLDPDPVVADREAPPGALLLRVDLDARWLRATELQRVGQEVLEHLSQLRLVGAH